MQQENETETVSEIQIAVCITAQSNSKRLIDRAGDLAKCCKGTLHILHVQKEESVFHSPEAVALLQELFRYGSEQGGMVHAFSDEDIAGCIGRFAKEQRIRYVVVGELPKSPMEQIGHENQFDRIIRSLPATTEVVVVEREQAI